MTNEETKKLCLALLHADTEAAAIAILTKAGLWDNPAFWRLY